MCDLSMDMKIAPRKHEEFDLEHVEFQTVINHPSRNIGQTFGDAEMEGRKES